MMQVCWHIWFKFFLPDALRGFHKTELPTAPLISPMYHHSLTLSGSSLLPPNVTTVCRLPLLFMSGLRCHYGASWIRWRIER